MFGIGEEERANLHKGMSNHIVVCFGSGQYGRTVQALLRQNGIAIQYFCDNSESLRGKNVNGAPILSFKELQKIAKNSKINLIITATAYDAIRKQVEESGIINEGLTIVN